MVTVIYNTPLEVPVLAMSECYGNKCTVKSLVHAVAAGHMSLLEHINVSIEMTMSQKCLLQFERHRHFSMTIESSRGRDMSKNGKFDAWVKPSAVSDTDWYQFIEDYGNLEQKSYNIIQDGAKAGIPLEYLAYALPLGSNVSGVITGNLRCWMEWLKKRLCKRASVEHQQLARDVYYALQNLYPEIVTPELIGICSGCKEPSCDFTVHKKQGKTPVIGEL